MRFFSTAVALSAVPAAVFAATQTVTVGDQGLLMFSPETITAAQGDTINFEFRAKNHSVTQSTFADPCTKGTFNGSPGVSSGFLAIPQGASLDGKFPTWSITLKDTKPLWFFCGQKNPVVHCQKGMVFSINPTAEKSHDAFVSAAKASTGSPSPDPASGAPQPGGAPPPGGATPSGSAASGAPSTAPDGSIMGTSPFGTSGSAASSPSAGVPGVTSPSGTSPFGDSSSAVSGAAATAGASNSESTGVGNASTSGASKTAFTRGAAGLFTVVAAVSAMLL